MVGKGRWVVPGTHYHHYTGAPFRHILTQVLALGAGSGPLPSNLVPETSDDDSGQSEEEAPVARSDSLLSDVDDNPDRAGEWVPIVGEEPLSPDDSGNA